MTTFNCAIPRQQQYIIGIWDVKGPASSFWPRPRKSLGRPRGFGLGLEKFWQHCLATTTRHRSFWIQAPMNRPNNVCTTSPTSTPTLDHSSSELANSIATFQCCSPYLIDCFASWRTPVERVFSQSGLIMSARQEHMSNAVLESLVFLKCNADI